VYIIVSYDMQQL